MDRACSVVLLILVAALGQPAIGAVQVGNYDTPGSAKDVERLGNLAFVADALSGMLVLDVSNPAAPLPIGSLAPIALGNVSVIAIEGARAYLGEGVGGISVVDISDPANPVRLGSLGGFSNVRDLVVAGDHLYVASNVQPGFYVVDVSDPAQPAQIASLPVTSTSLTQNGDILYAGDDVIDIADPANPVHVSFTGGVEIAIGDGFAVSTRPGRHDVTDPLVPMLVNSSFGALLGAQDLALSGELAWLPGSAGLWLYDVSDASSPHPTLASLALGASLTAYRIQLVGSRAYVAADGIDDGLHIVDTSDPENPALLGRLPGDFRDVDVAGSIAAVGVANGFSPGGAGLRIVDVSNPAAPGEIANWPLAGVAHVRLQGSRAYAVNVDASPDRLWVFDVANPFDPFPLGSYAGDSVVNAMQVIGNRVYLATRIGASGTNGALVVLDTTNPAAIVELGRYATTGQATGVAIVGTRAFLTSDAVEVLDVTFPAVISRLASFDLPDTVFDDPEPNGSRLHVGATRGQVLTLDFADLLMPQLLGTVAVAAHATTQLPRGDAAVAGSTLWYTDATLSSHDTQAGSGIGPRRLATFPTLTGGQIQLDAARELAFVTAGNDGLRVIDVAADLAAHECANGVDDDGDALVDHQQDGGCAGGGDPSERPDCSDGLDNDGDGQVDHPADADCASGAEASEDPDCNDGLDDDGDGLVDFGADPGCAGFGSALENPLCQDGLDNDGDGGFDFDGGAAANLGAALGPPDPQCNQAQRNKETPSGCGIGAELAIVGMLAIGVRARLSRAARRE